MVMNNKQCLIIGNMLISHFVQCIQPYTELLVALYSVQTVDVRSCSFCKVKKFEHFQSLERACTVQKVP